jgi:hypothetical protein
MIWKVFSLESQDEALQDSVDIRSRHFYKGENPQMSEERR